MEKKFETIIVDGGSAPQPTEPDAEQRQDGEGDEGDATPGEPEE